MDPYVLIHCDFGEYAAVLRSDARAGLFGPRLALPSRWCFDGRGRRLYERLAHTATSGLLRAETAALRGAAEEFAALTSARHLIRVGPDGAVPPLLLAEALSATGNLAAVSTMDTPHAQSPRYPVDYELVDLRHVLTDGLTRFPPLPDGPRLVHLTVAGFATLDAGERAVLLAALRRTCEPGDHLLVATPEAGVLATHGDLFDDPRGLGATFNRNVLNVLNHTLDADVTDTAFEHECVVPRPDRLELRLRARTGLRVELGTLGFHVDVTAGREVRTLRLFGLTTEELRQESRRAGFAVTALRHDPDRLVNLVLAEVV